MYIIHGLMHVKNKIEIKKFFFYTKKKIINNIIFFFCNSINYDILLIDIVN